MIDLAIADATAESNRQCKEKWELILNWEEELRNPCGDSIRGRYRESKLEDSIFVLEIHDIFRTDIGQAQLEYTGCSLNIVYFFKIL